MGKRYKKSENDSIKAPKKRQDIPFATHLAETSWRVALPFLVFAIGGIKLDEYIETSPLFSILGLLIALITVSVIVVRYVREHYPDTFNGIKG